ncbi:MAG: lysophospholipase [Acidobacteria bacterium]|nr:lysophospholipase [Acidobacteriota bacterium]
MAHGSQLHRAAVTRPNASRQIPLPIEQPLRVVTIGDSLAYGTGDEERKGIAGRLRNPMIDTTNLGVSGAETSDLLARLRHERTRTALNDADAIVLSIGANDLFRTPGAREETLHDPLAVAERILVRVEEVVAQLYRINPHARILILGAYNPVPNHQYKALINQYVGAWDDVLAARFESNPLVTVVKMYDLVTPQRLSRFDHFHPGGAAYEAAAKRIEAILR